MLSLLLWVGRRDLKVEAFDGANDEGRTDRGESGLAGGKRGLPELAANFDLAGRLKRGAGDGKLAQHGLRAEQ